MSRLAIRDRPQIAYADDVALWVDEQVALLRAGRLSEIDLPNIIGEIESVGSSQRSALNSQVVRIIEHLLRLRYSRATDPHRLWRESIPSARTEIEGIFDGAPSLRSAIDGDLATTHRRAIRNVVATLQDYGELDREAERRLRAETFTPAQILDDWFPPAR